jgi:hypothetical protein
VFLLSREGSEPEPISALLHDRIGETGRHQTVRESCWIDRDENISDVHLPPLSGVQSVRAYHQSGRAQHPSRLRQELVLEPG